MSLFFQLGLKNFIEAYLILNICLKYCFSLNFKDQINKINFKNEYIFQLLILTMNRFICKNSLVFLC